MREQKGAPVPVPVSVGIPWRRPSTPHPFGVIQKLLPRTGAADSARELPAAGQLAGGVGDVLGVDAGPGEQLGAGT